MLNARGGILGHWVKVEVLDNQGNPTLIEQRLSSGTKPDMVEPGSICTEGVVEVPIANVAKVLSTARRTIGRSTTRPSTRMSSSCRPMRHCRRRRRCSWPPPQRKITEPAIDAEAGQAPSA